MKKERFAVWTSMGLALVGYAPQAFATCGRRGSCGAKPAQPAPSQQAPAPPAAPAIPGARASCGAPAAAGGVTSYSTQSQKPMEQQNQQIWAVMPMPVSISADAKAVAGLAAEGASGKKLQIVKLGTDVLKATYQTRTTGQKGSNSTGLETVLVRGLTASSVSKRLKTLQGQAEEYDLYQIEIEWNRDEIAPFSGAIAVGGDGATAAWLQKEIENRLKNVVQNDFKFQPLHLLPHVDIRKAETVKAGYKGENLQEKVKSRLEALRQKAEAGKTEAAASPRK